MRKLSVKSPAFENGKFNPAKYKCDGDDVNPPLAIDEVSKETKTLMLIADDPNAPMGTWNHWVVWNIPENTRQIEENTVPGTYVMNDFGKRSYGGPCPPSGTHRYFFKVYALNVELALKPNSKKGIWKKRCKVMCLPYANL